MSTDQTQSISQINAATDAKLAERAATHEPTPASVAKAAVTAKRRATSARAAGKPSAKAAGKPVGKPTAASKTAPPAAPARKARKAATPAERAAKPVTATIASYVLWLDRTVFGGKMTEPQKKAAGISITLYGAYQISPERKAVRDGR
jgi:hypothetical protein